MLCQTANITTFRTWILLIVILCSACSQTGFQYIDRHYCEHRQFSASLLVMPLNSVFLDSSNLFDPSDLNILANHRFSWAELNYFNNYMGSALSEITTARILGIDPYFRLYGIKFKKEHLAGPDTPSMEMFCPESGIIRFNNITPDYVLFFESLYFDKEYQESMNNIGNGTNQNYSMEAGLKYLLWDNHIEKVIGFGQFSKYINLLHYPKKETYIELFEDYARAIIASSPFINKS